MNYYEMLIYTFVIILGWNHNKICKFCIKSIKYIVNSTIDFMKVLKEF